MKLWAQDTLRRNLYLSNITRSQVEVFRLQAEQFLPAIGVGSQPLGLTLKRATFSRREVIQELCATLRPGMRLDAATLEAQADSFLASDRVVPLIQTSDPPMTLRALASAA